MFSRQFWLRLVCWSYLSVFSFEFPPFWPPDKSPNLFSVLCAVSTGSRMTLRKKSLDIFKLMSSAKNKQRCSWGGEERERQRKDKGRHGEWRSKSGLNGWRRGRKRCGREGKKRWGKTLERWQGGGCRTQKGIREREMGNNSTEWPSVCHTRSLFLPLVPLVAHTHTRCSRTYTHSSSLQVRKTFCWFSSLKWVKCKAPLPHASNAISKCSIF